MLSTSLSRPHVVRYVEHSFSNRLLVVKYVNNLIKDLHLPFALSHRYLMGRDDLNVQHQHDQYEDLPKLFNQHDLLMGSRGTKKDLNDHGLQPLLLPFKQVLSHHFLLLCHRLLHRHLLRGLNSSGLFTTIKAI